MASEPKPSTELEVQSPTGEGSAGITVGIFFAAAFYGAVYLFPNAWLQRYFLGHPVCVGATMLFSIAAGILVIKTLRVSAERKLAAGLRDAELSPAPMSLSPSGQWVIDHDAGRAAKAWLKNIGDLSQAARKSRLVNRLVELLQRQSGRVSTRILSDDLRELSARDGDAAHDSLQLVRIIIWAIPMLGFLGTVVGITQTLGGLDFTDGNAAVDRLKSGLYVAFDTTALGLVLSVIAIFLQFPVEKAEQQLLGEIDRRVGNLLNSTLPADDASDNPAGQIAKLCDGIRIAVGESLASQTDLWRQTIDEAHLHWERIAEDNGQRIGDAIMQNLAPALREHASVVIEQTRVINDQTTVMREQLSAITDQTTWHRKNIEWQKSHVESQREQYEAQHEQAQRFALSQQQAQAAAIEELDSRWEHWTTMLTQSTQALSEQQQLLATETRSINEGQERASQLLQLQTSLDASLLRVAQASEAAQAAISATAKGGMSHAMMTLATAVDVLAKRMPEDTVPTIVSTELRRRAA